MPDQLWFCRHRRRWRAFWQAVFLGWTQKLLERSAVDCDSYCNWSLLGCIVYGLHILTQRVFVFFFIFEVSLFENLLRIGF